MAVRQSDGPLFRSHTFFLYPLPWRRHRSMSATPRIPLLEREFAAPDAQKIYDALLAARGVVPNMFKILGYRPEIAQGVAGFLKPLLSDGALPGFYKNSLPSASRIFTTAYMPYAHTASPPVKKAPPSSKSQASQISKPDRFRKKKNSASS